MTKENRSFVSLAPTDRQNRSVVDKIKGFINKKLTVTRQELLATQDVNIITKKKMRIYAFSNLVAYLIQLGCFAVV